MATRRIEIQKFVKKIRRYVTEGCKECGRSPPQGLMLGGPGPTFSEMVMEPGMTMNLIVTEVATRGFMCRRCWNYATRVKASVELSCAREGNHRTQEELMRDPKIREKMKEFGTRVPDNMLERGVPQIEGL